METQLFIFSISLSSIFYCSAFNPPSTAYFLNCGSSTNTTTFSHGNPPRTFTSDSQFLSPSTSKTVSLTSPIKRSDPLYNTARLFTQTYSYTFPINSAGTYVLRLHFFPFTTSTHNLASSNFNVSAPQTFLLGSFSPSRTITIKEYYLWLDSNGFTLTFTPNFPPSLAFISAIELFTAPTFLIDNATEPNSVSTTTTRQDLNTNPDCARKIYVRDKPDCSTAPEMNILGSAREINNSRTSSAHENLLVFTVAAALFIIITAITIFILMRKRSKQAPAPLNPKANTTTAVVCSPHHNDSINKSSSGTTPKIKKELELYIPLSDIKLATNDFDEALVIGHGGFGKVYKGVLCDGTMVAVKRATGRSRQGYPEFVNEINLLSKIRHRNLVSIIGYCDEMEEMILVYEFMEKGTLKSYLYGSRDLPCLSWKQRLQICIGAARGLYYLHNAHSPVIIHRDVKSTNILLGQDFLAKISDFGISKLGPLLGEETYVSTGVKGSFGYFDPEYFTMLKLTTKSDVYSFGVVLLEVLCARTVIDPRCKDEAINLADWALHYMKKGKLEKILDVRLPGELTLSH